MLASTHARAELPTPPAASKKHIQHLILDDKALVHIRDAYVYVGLRRSAIHYRMSKKSKYFDSRFPKPAPVNCRGTFFYRGDLIAYATLPQMTCETKGVGSSRGAGGTK